VLTVPDRPEPMLQGQAGLVLHMDRLCLLSSGTGARGVSSVNNALTRVEARMHVRCSNVMGPTLSEPAQISRSRGRRHCLSSVVWEYLAAIGDPITTGVSEFGLQNSYKWESPTRLQYRAVEHSTGSRWISPFEALGLVSDNFTGERFFGDLRGVDPESA
jgi:hypothetical protein